MKSQLRTWIGSLAVALFASFAFIAETASAKDVAAITQECGTTSGPHAANACGVAIATTPQGACDAAKQAAIDAIGAAINCALCPDKRPCDKFVGTNAGGWVIGQAQLIAPGVWKCKACYNGKFKLKCADC